MVTDKMLEKCKQMYRLCDKAHAGQKYGDLPYMRHLLNVCDVYETLIRDEYDNYQAEVLMACIGHDLLEDTDVTKEGLLTKGFPVDVVTAIDLVTKKPEVPYEEYISKIGENELAFNVKVCDTYSNLTESLKDGNKRRIMRYATQLQKLYDAKKF